MKRVYVLISFSLCYGLLLQAQEIKWKVPGQDSAYPIFSSIDTNEIQKKYLNLFDEEGNPKVEHMMQYRKFLKSYVDKGDACAMTLYASSLIFDGLKKPGDIDTAFLYYHKASENNLAEADELLSGLYQCGYMHIKPDPEKAFIYLQRAILHVDNVRKSKLYARLAFVYEEGSTDGFTHIKPNADSCIFFLEKAISLNPQNTLAIQGLALRYEYKGIYKKAFELYLQSGSNTLEIAKWLIEGKYISKDVQRGLQLIFPIAEEEMSVKEDGERPAVWLLNYLMYCKKLLTKEQVGKYLITDNFACD